MTPICRCRTLPELLRALDAECELLRGDQDLAQIGCSGRVQPLGLLRMGEELYDQRLSLRLRQVQAGPMLLLLQHGRCIIESGGVLLHLLAAEHNACLITGTVHDFTVTQAPCRLVRLQLPQGTQVLGSGGAVISHPRSWPVDLGLLLPMGRLLEQAQRHPAEAHTRSELADTLLAYLWDRLAAAGCRVELPAAVPASADALSQLDTWLVAHLGDPLELADLAAAVNLSPRRLQQLCRDRHGCSPMEWLRRQRVERLQHQLRDPQHAGKSLAALMAGLQLSDSAATRNTFVRRFGCTPAAYRRGARGRSRREAQYPLRSGLNHDLGL